MFTVFLRSPSCGERPANLTEISDELEKSITQLKYISYQIIGPSLVIAGILGNILNLIVLSRPFFNECTRIYLRALAAADLILLILEISTLVRLNELQNSSPLTAFYYAHLELVSITLLIAFNVYIVLCLTIDRYVSVCLPTLFNLVHTPKRAKIITVLCLIVAILISLPLCVLKTTCRSSYKWSFEDNLKVTRTIHWKIYIGVSETLIRIAPAIILAILNILIIRKFRSIQKTRSRLSKSSKNSRKRYKEEKRLITILQAVVLLFFFTMIPASCLSFFYSESKEYNLMFETFRATANLLEITNSSLNFCAYYLCSQDFRKNILSAFGCSSNGSAEKEQSSLTSNNFNGDTTIVAETNNTVVTITNLLNKINH